MSNGATAASVLDPVAEVEAWRTRSEAAVDPVRFGVIEALARRAASQQGEVRRLMMQRVEVLLAEHAAAMRPPSSRAATEPAGRRAALAGLSELIDRLGRLPDSPTRASSLPRPSAAGGANAPGTASLIHAAPPAPLRSVTAFRGTWMRLRTEQRLRQALDQVPAMAGPLNSSHLVSRALRAMHDLSPDYLDAFMSHIDTLLWLEQASGGDLAPRRATPNESRRRPGPRAAGKT